MKKCFKCLKKKPLDKFYVHKRMGDGHLGKCIACTKKDVHERYVNPKFRSRIIEYEKTRFKDPARKLKVLEYQRNRRLKFKGKSKAYQKVHRSISNGSLKKKPCEKCGNVKSQAHHEDYRKPLAVKWLCFKHHRETHNQIVN